MNTFPEARRGHHPEQVRAYLAKIAAKLGHLGVHDVGRNGRATALSDEIRRRRFATVHRGSDPLSVDGYLERLAAQVEALERPTNT